MSRRIPAILVAFILLAPTVAAAADIPYAVRQAVVMVQCDYRQGSGVVVNGDKGYVLTNAHIVLDLDTNLPDFCEVGFIAGGAIEPTIFYDATVVHAVYEEPTNGDFAILKLGDPFQRRTLATFPFLKTNEFSQVGDAISVIGYPGAAYGSETVTDGTISGLERGIVKTDALISPGSSGGAGVDADDNLIGLATRILIREISPGVEEVVDYELVDIRAVLNWMDTFGPDAHDRYVTHANPARYHGPSPYIVSASLQCSMLAKSALASTVYCLHADGTRSVFPTDDVYHSWFADFSGVVTLPLDQLAAYRLSSNVTMKPGTLVKIESDPKVYLVTDAAGALRLIQSESQARDLYGDGWAGFVKDVPVTFFGDYFIVAPLP